MSSFSIQNVAAVDRPYEWGHAAARAGGTRLWDYWNGPTANSRVAELEAGGRWRVKDGTEALPAFSFVDDTDAGLYRIGADNVGLALGGSKVVDVKTTGIEVPGLTVDNVAYLGSLAAGALLYASATNTLGALGRGTGGQQLQMDSAGEFPVWGDAVSAFSITGLTTASISDSDKIPFSDESETGDPNRAITFANFKNSLNIASFSISGLTTASIADEDKIPFSDEGTADDPNRAITFANFKTALNIQSSFDLHDDVTTAAQFSLADDDRMLVSDEDTAGDPNRYVTLRHTQELCRSHVAPVVIDHEQADDRVGGEHVTDHGRDERERLHLPAAAGGPPRRLFSIVSKLFAGPPIKAAPGTGCRPRRCSCYVAVRVVAAVVAVVAGRTFPWSRRQRRRGRCRRERGR